MNLFYDVLKRRTPYSDPVRDQFTLVTLTDFKSGPYRGQNYLEVLTFVTSKAITAPTEPR